MPRKKKTSKTQRFIETARRQFRRSCIPTATAVCLSVGISKLGVPALPLILVGGAGYAYWRGWRIRLVRTAGEGKPAQSVPANAVDSESSAEGGRD